MILHPYSHGDLHISNNYYGHGFGSIFAKLFSKIASKTASRAALSAAKRVGSRLVKTGIKKVIPVAKKTIKSALKTGIKKATPIAKDLVKKGVKRAAEEANNFIANKVQKVEDFAIKKGVSPDLAHSVSDLVEEGAREGISDLTKLAHKKSDKIFAERLNKSKNIKNTERQGKKPKKSNILKGKSRRKIAYQIQNLIDSA